MYRPLVPAIAAAAMMGVGISFPADAQKATTGSGNDTSAPTMQSDTKQDMSPASGAGTDESAAAPRKASFDASELMGKDVFDPSGNEIATIKKVIPETGEAQDVVLSVGGILGIGAKEVRYPANKIERGADGELRVSTTEEELSKLPAEGETQSN